MLKSTVEMTDLSELTARFDELGDVLRNRAANRAVRRTFTKARKDASIIVRNSYKIRAGDLKTSAFKITIASGSGEMALTSKRIGLGYFNPQIEGNSVSVNITQTTASRIKLNSNNLFVPSILKSGRQSFKRNQQRKLIKGAFIIPKSKMKYKAGMLTGESSGVFVKERTNQINAKIGSGGKAQATRVKRIKRLFTISTAEMIASGGLSTQINNTIVNEFSRIYESELKGFVAALRAGRVQKL